MQKLEFKKLSHRVSTSQKKSRKIPNILRKTNHDAQESRKRTAISKNKKSFKLMNLLSSMKLRKSSVETQTADRLDSEINIDEQPVWREEVYIFDHGEPSQYHTTDRLPMLKSEKLAEAVQLKHSAFWAEFFGYFNVILIFFTTFFIQFYR